MSEAGDGDGLGQSLAEDVRWLIRFRRAKAMSVTWRRPDADEARWWDARYGPFADWVYAVTEVDGRRWVVLERTWHGWPDPPEYAWFALNADGSLWAARDFDWWPTAWTPPPTTTPPP